MKKDIHKYSDITFENKMKKMDLWDLINNYKYIRESIIRLYKMFKNLSKKFKSKDDDKVKILYNKIHKELEQVKILDVKLKELLNILQMVADEDLSHDLFLYKLSKMFKNRLTEYIYSFYNFKETFSILRKWQDN